MLITIGDAIDPSIKKKLKAMMVKKAIDIFTEAVKQFVKAVMGPFTAAIWQAVNFLNSVNHILEADRTLIASWENEGGALHGRPA